MREERIREIGRKANALRRAGFYDADEVRWIAEHARSGGSLLIEVEVLVENGVQMMRNKGVDLADLG